MSKRGISTIIATVLIVLITVSAVVILWTAILPLIDQDIPTTYNSQLNIVTRDSFTFYDQDDNKLSLQVELKGDEQPDAIQVLITLDDGTQYSSTHDSPTANGRKKMTFNLQAGETPVEISVAPIFQTENGVTLAAVSSNVDVPNRDEDPSYFPTGINPGDDYTTGGIGTEFTSSGSAGSGGGSTCNDNGIIEIDENCDNGGGDGDGCSSTCVIESGWDCTGDLGESSSCVDLSVLSTGLLTYYSFEGGSTNDQSGNNIHGTAKNGAAPTTDNGEEVFSFDGNDDFICLDSAGDCGSSDSRAIFDGTFTTRSISLKFKANDVSPSPAQMLFEEGGQSNGMNIYISSGEVKGGAWVSSSGEWITASTDNTNWHNVILIFSPNQLIFYYDGAEQTVSTSFSSMAAHIGDDSIGSITDGSRTISTPFSGAGESNYYSGLIDEFRVYDKVLSQEEIDYLSNQ